MSSRRNRLMPCATLLVIAVLVAACSTAESPEDATAGSADDATVESPEGAGADGPGAPIRSRRGTTGTTETTFGSNSSVWQLALGQAQQELPYAVLLPEWLPREDLGQPWLAMRLPGSTGSKRLEETTLYVYYAPRGARYETATLGSVYEGGGIAITAFTAEGRTIAGADAEETNQEQQDERDAATGADAVETTESRQVPPVRGQPASASVDKPGWGHIEGLARVAWVEPFNDEGISYIVTGRYDVAVLHKIADSMTEAG